MLYQKLISYVIIAKILTFCLFLHIFLRCFAIDLVPDLSLCESYFFMKFSRSKYMRTNWKKYLYLENTENKFCATLWHQQCYFLLKIVLLMLHHAILVPHCGTAVHPIFINYIYYYYIKYNCVSSLIILYLLLSSFPCYIIIPIIIILQTQSATHSEPGFFLQRWGVRDHRKQLATVTLEAIIVYIESGITI